MNAGQVSFNYDNLQEAVENHDQTPSEVKRRIKMNHLIILFFSLNFYSFACIYLTVVNKSNYATTLGKFRNKI